MSTMFGQDSLTCGAVVSEARKRRWESGEHGVTNELVYLPDAVPVLGGSRSTSSEIYLRSDVRVHFAACPCGQRRTHYEAVIESLRGKIQGHIYCRYNAVGLDRDDALGDIRKVNHSSLPYFPPSVSFFQIPDSFRNLAQAVTPVDDRCYLSGPHELAHDG
jgi:hypothetical protein